MHLLLATEGQRKILEGIRDGFLSFLPVAGIAIAFGIVYWLIRRRVEAKKQAALTKWADERKAKRLEKKTTPDGR